MKIVFEIVIGVIIAIAGVYIITNFVAENIYQEDSKNITNEINIYNLTNQNITRFSIDTNEEVNYNMFIKSGSFNETKKEKLQDSHIIDIFNCGTDNYQINLTLCNIYNEREKFNYTLSPITSQCCGDGNIDEKRGEKCDGINLAGKSCLDFGLTGTGLSCNSNCDFDNSNCN